MAAIPISTSSRADLRSIPLGVDWLQLPGWRWLFILEGLPAVILGLVTLFYLTSYPHQAKWLSSDEREWITSEFGTGERIKRDCA